MIVHTNIEKYTIFYTIMHGPKICTINKSLVELMQKRKTSSFLPWCICQHQQKQACPIKATVCNFSKLNWLWEFY